MSELKNETRFSGLVGMTDFVCATPILKNCIKSCHGNHVFL